MPKMTCKCGWKGESKHLLRSIAPRGDAWVCPKCAKGEGSGDLKRICEPKNKRLL